MFRAPCGSGDWGWVDSGGGWLGCAPTHVHMHVHAHMHMRAHAHVINMIISCKCLPPLGESLGIPYDVIRACVCVHACACAHVWGHPLTTPHPPATPRGDPWNRSKFNSTWTNWDISIPFEDLKSVETSPPMGGCIVRWVGWWVGSGQNTKNLKNFDLIEIIEFCLKIYDLLIHLHPHPHPWVGQWVGLGQMTNNWINLDPIEIIQFCFKIYDL